MYSLLYTFKGGVDGSGPAGNLTIVTTGPNSGIFGTTNVGGGMGCYGKNGCGTIFEVPLDGGSDSVLYSFQNGKDGALPHTGLTLVGATGYGVDSSTLFSGTLNPRQENNLVNFGNSYPSSPLITDGKGNLYGTTAFGGDTTKCVSPTNTGCGVVYQYNIATKKVTVLYQFEGGADGTNPGGLYGALAFDRSGTNLYGITTYGGTGSLSACANGCGTVFKLTPAGATWVHTVIYSFKGNVTNCVSLQTCDGWIPTVFLLASDGNFYGLTEFGGTGSALGCGKLPTPQGCGTLFKIDPTTDTYTSLYDFQGATDGISPSGLVDDKKNSL